MQRTLDRDQTWRLFPFSFVNWFEAAGDTGFLSNVCRKREKYKMEEVTAGSRWDKSFLSEQKYSVSWILIGRNSSVFVAFNECLDNVSALSFFKKRSYSQKRFETSNYQPDGRSIHLMLAKGSCVKEDYKDIELLQGGIRRSIYI